MGGEDGSDFLALDDGDARGAAGRAASAPAVIRRDPICGMELLADQAAGSSDFKGTTYYFCSEACRRQFETVVGLRTAMAQTGSTIRAPRDVGGGQPARGRPLAVRVRGVSKTYVTHGLWPLVRRTTVLTDASLEVPAGNIVAIVGGNGSGKSTLMNIIAGLLDRDAGTVEIRGRIGHCPQQPVLYEKLTVAESFKLFGVAYALDSAEVTAGKAELMAALDFGQYDDVRVEHLSGGTKQKLSLGLALLHDPDVLLLDEPYSGFDYETYLRFWELSEELSARGRAIVVISHFVQQRERFDRIYRVKDGRCERER